jgi:hypothetical protein
VGRVATFYKCGDCKTVTNLNKVKKLVDKTIPDYIWVAKFKIYVDITEWKKDLVNAFDSFIKDKS